MKTDQNHKQILIFIGLVLGLSYQVFRGPVALLKLRTANLVGRKIYNLPAFLLFLIGGFVPSLAGIALIRIYDGKSRVKDILGSAIDYKTGLQTYLIIIACPAATSPGALTTITWREFRRW